MIRTKISTLFTYAAATLVLTNCSLNFDKAIKNLTDSAKGSGSLLKCEVSTSSGDVSIVSGDSVDMTATVTGGVAPYTLNGQTASFDSTTTFARSYTNPDSTTKWINDSILVLDSLGLATQCHWAVSVLADSTPVVPSVSFTLSPSNTVEVDESITIMGSTLNFSSTPTFQFIYTESGIAIHQNAGQASFYVVDGQPHQFTVTMQASNSAGESASTTVELRFDSVSTTAAPVCMLSRSAGSYEVGTEIDFTVSATSGEALEWTFFEDGVGGTTQMVSDSMAKVTYSSAGNKLVAAKARSKSSGLECNLGSYLTDNFVVNAVSAPTLSCTARTQFRNYNKSETVWAKAEVPSGVGVGSVQVVSVRATPTSNGFYWLYPSSPLWSSMYFPNQGQYFVTMTIKDSANNQAQCTTPSITIW